MGGQIKNDNRSTRERSPNDDAGRSGNARARREEMQHAVCNGVPRTIGRTIRGTLSSGVKIIDVSGAKLELGAEITHIVHIQID